MSYVVTGRSHHEINKIYLAETYKDAETYLEGIGAFKSKYRENTWTKIVKKTRVDGFYSSTPIRFTIREVTGVIAPGGESLR